ncbi:MAG TPA: sulfatase [Solirubrobacteraceae bacterium]|nr:sulfatase [Solirubrobacteraceae bacterium]
MRQIGSASDASASCTRRRAPRPGRLLLGVLASALALGLLGCGGGSARDDAGALARVSPVHGGTPAPGPGAGHAIGGDRRPNIVFVLTDDLAENLVAYMPHVLRMQRRGVSFDNYFVSDSLCCPSRASILTGRFPHDTRVFDNSPPEGGYSVFRERGEERETFALALQRQGYSTALMGKYLNGYKPNGAVAGLGLGATAGDGASIAAGAQGPARTPPGWSEWDVAGDGYPEYGYHMNSDGRVRAYGFRPQDYLTDVIARRGLAFIDRAAARGKPFMLELATFAPHSPYTPAARDYGEFPGLQAPRTPAFNAFGSAEPDWLRHFGALEPSELALIDANFRKRAQAVQAVDRMIGEIEAELAAKGLARNTYIVFSSDNGLHMGEHRLRPGKLTAFDTDIKVPLVVTGPDVPAGRVVHAMAENIDLCPTFEELAGALVPPSVDGHGLLGLIRGAPARGWRNEVLIEHHGRVLDESDPDLPLLGSGNPPSYEALRMRHALYVEYVTGEREYYDLRRDPYELNNLAAQLPPARLRRLHRALVRVERCHGARACWLAEHGTTTGRRLAR